jgi:hypothetical protein
MAEKVSLFGRLMAKAGLAEIEQPVAPAAQQPATPSEPVATPTVSTGAIKGMVDQNIRAQLLQAISDDQETNPIMRGIDAFEYSKGLKIAQGATLAARAKSAFDQANAFATSPLTKTHLKTTLQGILGVLEQEANGFESHLNEMIAKEVGPQESQLSALEQSNQEIDAKIEALKAQRQENVSQINTLSGEIFTKRRNLDQTAANFQATLEDVINEYQEVNNAIDTLPEDSVSKV